MRLPRTLNLWSSRSLMLVAFMAVCCSVSSGLLGAAQPGGQADEWTTFRNGPTLPGVATTTLPEQPELLWEVATPDGVTSTPVIQGGAVYVGTLSGDLLCLDLATGKVRWKYRSIESTDPAEFAPGFAAAIGIQDGRVFAGDDQGVFHAVETTTGKKIWSKETGAEIVGGVSFQDGNILFGSHDGRLYCLKATDGSEVWSFETQGPVNATPALVGDFTFITGCDKPFMRVVETRTGTQHEEIPLSQLMIASCSIRDDILYFGTDGGAVVALDWKKKERVWTYSVPNREQQIQSSPAVTDELVVIGSRDKHLHAIDRKSGKGVWTFATRARIDSSPVVVGDRVYFGSSDRFLYGLSLKDGKQVWKYSVGQAVTGSPAIAEGRMVIGSETSNGRIMCFGARSSGTTDSK